MASPEQNSQPPKRNVLRRLAEFFNANASDYGAIYYAADQDADDLHGPKDNFEYKPSRLDRLHFARQVASLPLTIGIEDTFEWDEYLDKQARINHQAKGLLTDLAELETCEEPTIDFPPETDV